MDKNLRCRWDLPRILRSVDMTRFEQLRAKYRDASPYPGYSKYLDIEMGMRRALYSVYELGLHRARPKSVLDLGTGCGYFPYICKYFGHAAVAVDLDEVPMYNEFTQFLRLDKRVSAVRAFQNLPDLGRRFDVVTAFAICFNNHDAPNLWGPDEWLFFLKDMAANQLTTDGRVLLKMNQEADGSYGSYGNQPLLQFFRQNGAVVDGERVYFASVSQFRTPAADLRARASGA
jgi:SAM-dependent methyltransferase